LKPNIKFFALPVKSKRTNRNTLTMAAAAGKKFISFGQKIGLTR
jgi:dihydroorotase